MMVILAVTLSLAILAPATSLEATPPAKFTIHNQGYKVDKKGPVPFAHQEHFMEHKIACTECHHVYEEGKNVWKETDPVGKCVTCHDPLKKKGKTLKLQNAYHNRCRTCHRKLVKGGHSQSAPYRKCNRCHLKRT
jgi:hypothetical protein